MVELARELVDSVNEVLNNEALSVKVVRSLLKQFGGAQIYLPKIDTAFKEEDAAAIYNKYDGTNMRAMCHEYNLSSSSIYRILRGEMARRKSWGEKCLPGELDFVKGH